MNANLKYCWLFLFKICLHPFKTKAALTKHATKHVAPGGFICRECKLPFVTDTERSMHRELKHKVGFHYIMF